MLKLPTSCFAVLLGAVVLSACGGSSTSKSTSGQSSASTAASTSATQASPAGTSGMPATSTAGSSTGSGSTVSDSADPSGQLRFTASTLSAKAGTLTVHFTNGSPLPHNFTLASSSGTVLGASPTFSGGSRTLTVKLAPGTYVFYCTVPGHRQAGMQGTLKVT